MPSLQCSNLNSLQLLKSIMTTLPSTGRLGTSRKNYVSQDRSRNEYSSIVSPMSFDIEDVPCWNDVAFDDVNTGRRIGSARGRSRVGTSGGMRGNQLGHSQLRNQFLPGLDMAQQRHDGANKTRLFRENSRTAHVATGRRGFLESGNSSYRVETQSTVIGGAHYPRNISTAGASTGGRQNDSINSLFSPIDTKNKSNNNHMRGNQPLCITHRSNASGLDNDSAGDMSIEPWAYKVIEKYNNPSVRPISRTSSRISREEMMNIKSGGGNEHDRREGLLRVKSLGRFKCT